MAHRHHSVTRPVGGFDRRSFLMTFVLPIGAASWLARWPGLVRGLPPETPQDTNVEIPHCRVLGLPETGFPHSENAVLRQSGAGVYCKGISKH
jgi:hypothetical protein